MGMKKMFTCQAEFGNLVENSGNVSIPNVAYKSVIEVNEERTEAAASTVCRIF